MFCWCEITNVQHAPTSLSRLMLSPGSTGRPRHLPMNADKFDFGCNDAVKLFDTVQGFPSLVFASDSKVTFTFGFRLRWP